MTLIRVLQIAGNERHAWHNWQETAPRMAARLEDEPDIAVDTSHDAEDLARLDLPTYHVLLLNYTNWEAPGLSAAAKAAFVDYLHSGGGLYIHHFSNGAFHFSLPNAEDSDWPEYRKICRRVWDHSTDSGHDRYGRFDVQITETKHPITKGLEPFTIEDELYFKQQGDAPITPLIEARSRQAGGMEPLAWPYSYGQGRVFQNLLGHSGAAVGSEGFGNILVNAVRWLAASPQEV